MAILKINDDRSKKQAAVASSSYQTKSFSSGVLLYCSKAELPSSLSQNALIFTYDTAELFVGTGSGIQKLKLGSEEDLNPKIYLKIDDARRLYKTITSADQDKAEITESLKTLDENVYSKEEIDQFLTEDVDLDGVIDRLDTYTVAKINELFDEKAAAADVYTQEQVNDLVNGAKDTATTDLNAAKEELAASISSLDTKTTAADNTLNNRITQNVQSLIDKIDEDISTTKTELETEINSLSEKETADKEELTQKINTDISTLSENINTELTNIKGDITALTEDLETKNTALTESINTVTETLNTRITESVTTLENSVSTLSNNLSGQITELNQTLTTQISSVEENLSTSIKTTDDYAKVVNSKINNLQKKVYTKEETYTKQEVEELINQAIQDVLIAITAAISGTPVETPEATEEPVIPTDGNDSQNNNG